MNDTETTCRYCNCTRHETKHEVRSESWISGATGDLFEDNWLVCTECGEEKEA